MAEFKFNPLLEKLRITFSAGEGEYNYFQNSSGLKLFYRYFLPSVIEKIIVVSHGAGGNGDYYVLLADQLICENTAVYVMDYQGHGYSDGKKGNIKNFEFLLSDLNEFINLIKNKHPDIPIFLFGESMGGAVVINYLHKFKENISGIILFSPALKLNVKLSLKDFFMMIPAAIIYLIYPSYPLINMDRDNSGNANPIHCEYDKTDKLHLKKLSPRYLLQLNKHIKKAFLLADKIKQPIVIFQGEKDPYIDVEAVKSFYERCQSSNKELYLIPNALHTLFTDSNANLKENNVWKMLRDWIKKH